jgi:hypothetical protein
MKDPNIALFEDRRVAVERGARSAGDFDGENLADVAGGAFEDDDLVRAGAPGESLGVVATGTFAEDFDLGADEGVEFHGDMPNHNEPLLEKLTGRRRKFPPTGLQRQFRPRGPRFSGFRPPVRSARRQHGI